MMTNTIPAVDLGVVDRLDEKIRLLIAAVERSRADVQRLRTDNDRLTREVDTLKGQLADAETVSAELLAMRDERDQVRTRVATMLDQLEALQL
jgi:FtsZ-binding cell division protein ZapB